jgi:hypothetical protein
MKSLTNFGVGGTPTQGSFTETAVAQRTTILYANNPLYLRNLVLTDQGLLILKGTTQVMFPVSELIAAASTLEATLTHAPEITVQPDDVIILTPTATTFSITAVSDLELDYQWQISTDGGSVWSNLTDAGVYTDTDTDTLAISNTTGLNDYEYRCVATNTIGSATSDAALLTTDVVPSISAHPENASVADPASATFSVTASSLLDLTYQWQCSTNGGTTWIDIEIGDNYTGTIGDELTIVATTSGMNGYKYRCVVSSVVGDTTSNAATLTVT